MTTVAAELEKVKAEYASYRRRAMELIKEKEDLVRGLFWDRGT